MESIPAVTCRLACGVDGTTQLQQQGCICLGHCQPCIPAVSYSLLHSNSLMTQKLPEVNASSQHKCGGILVKKVGVKVSSRCLFSKQQQIGYESWSPSIMAKLLMRFKFFIPSLHDRQLRTKAPLVKYNENLHPRFITDNVGNRCCHVQVLLGSVSI